MNNLKYFIHDLFCIDSLDKETINAIFLTNERTKMKYLSYDNIFSSERAKRIVKVNAIYKSYFKPNKLPARTCIGVTGLAVGASVEIDLIAKQ